MARERRERERGRGEGGSERRETKGKEEKKEEESKSTIHGRRREKRYFVTNLGKAVKITPKLLKHEPSEFLYHKYRCQSKKIMETLIFFEIF